DRDRDLARDAQSARVDAPTPALRGDGLRIPDVGAGRHQRDRRGLPPLTACCEAQRAGSRTRPPAVRTPGQLRQQRSAAVVRQLRHPPDVRSLRAQEHRPRRLHAPDADDAVRRGRLRQRTQWNRPRLHRQLPGRHRGEPKPIRGLGHRRAPRRLTLLDAGAEAAGGYDALRSLDTEPLPSEKLNTTGVAEDIIDRLRSLEAAILKAADELFGEPELATVTLRLLTEIARADPEIFRR